eukprot:3393117-Prymnesium_polylepis.1
MVLAWHAIAPRGLSWYSWQDRASIIPSGPAHVEDAITALYNGTIDALFVGFGLHYVLRKEHMGSRPWHEQHSWRMLNVARMARIARETGRP